MLRKIPWLRAAGTGARWLSIPLAALLGALLSSPVGSAIQAPPEDRIVTAREIRVTDERGRVRARIGDSRRTPGHFGLTLIDERGTERIRVAMAPEGNGGLVIEDAEGRFRAAITLSQTGIPGVSLTDSEGRLRTLLFVSEGGNPQTELYDDKSRIRIGMGVGTDGEPSIRLDGPREASAWGAGLIGFRVPGTGDLAVLGRRPETGGALLLRDAEGTERLFLQAAPSGERSPIEVRKADGSIQWSVPERPQ